MPMPAVGIKIDVPPIRDAEGVPIVSAASNDEVIGEGDAQFFRASLEPPGENAVLSAGGAISRGMIVPDQDGRGAVPKSLPEDLSRTDQGTGAGSLAENKVGDDMPFRIQTDQAEAFCTQSGSFGENIGGRHAGVQNAGQVLAG